VTGETRRGAGLCDGLVVGRGSVEPSRKVIAQTGAEMLAGVGVGSGWTPDSVWRMGCVMALLNGGGAGVNGGG
jgi:hypothetical protein